MTSIKIIPDEYRGYRALSLFRMGFDTADIAKFYNLDHESQALEIVSRQRGAELGLSSGYSDPRPSKPLWPSGRVGFAGRP